MTARLLGVLALAVTLSLALLGGAALAVEDEELPTIDEIGTQSETAREFFPESAEEQPFTEALVIPLLVVGFLGVLVIGVLYLKWQPEFDREDSGRR